MYIVKISYHLVEDYFFNKKENAVKYALEKYEEFITDQINRYAGNRNRYIKNIYDSEKEYLSEIKDIKNANFESDWISIYEIETKD